MDNNPLGKALQKAVHKFGLFELNTGIRQLHKQGRRVRLQEQPLRVLEILLERPGELVSREELRQRLWPGDIHVNFEIGLNGAIKRLRLALHDSADSPRFIETIPKYGYRFLAPVRSVHGLAEPENSAAMPTANQPTSFVADAPQKVLPDVPANAPQEVLPDVPANAASARRRRRSRSLGIAVLCAAIVSVGYWVLPLAQPPHLSHITKLTNSGDVWSSENLMTDGTRVYYTGFTNAAGFQCRQVLSNRAGETVVAGLAADLLIRGLSPDHTMFLAVSLDAVQHDLPSPVWVVPVVGGQPRRLGNLQGGDFTWSRDGKLLAWAWRSELFLADRDGSGEHPLATVPGVAFYLRWSLDGGRLRFNVLGEKGELSIWEVSATGQGLHQLQFNWPGAPAEGYGDWTHDGHYFIFASSREGNSNLWAIEEQPDWLHSRRSEPIQLTAGPISYFRPLPSRDGTQIFAVGRQSGGELVRYDVTKKEFTPFLGGRSVEHLDFTRDGRWVTYVAYPEGTLWRANSDGSQEMRLTSRPLEAYTPRWSPDGKKIAFVGKRPGEWAQIYTVSVDGGKPEPIVSESVSPETRPNWSPAGDSLIYSLHPVGKDSDLHRIDLRSRLTKRIPASYGLSFPALSLDGRYVAARFIAGGESLVLVDLKTGKRANIATGKVAYPTWSSDSQYVYFNNTFHTEKPAFFRVNISTGKVEEITEVPAPAASIFGMWMGLAPDGSPLLLRSREQTDVYALSFSTH